MREYHLDFSNPSSIPEGHNRKKVKLGVIGGEGGKFSASPNYTGQLDYGNFIIFILFKVGVLIIPK